RGYKYFDLAILELVFCFKAQFACEAAMVCGNCLFSESLGKIESYTLGKTTRVNEDERGAMLLHELGNAIAGFIPEFVAGYRAKLLPGHFNGEIQRSFVPDVDNH